MQKYGLQWDKDDPLHREIMDANKEAFIAQQAAELQAQYDALVQKLPWWARLYIRVAGWFVRA